MKFTFADSDANLVRSYQPGRLLLRGETLTENVLLTGESVERWPVTGAQTLTEADFDPVLVHRPDVVLVGTGERQIILSPRLFRRLIEAGIGVEIMATAPAVRTFNVLLAEDRSILAALIL